MSGSLPTSPTFSEMSVRSVQKTVLTRAISGRRQVRQIGGQYWIINASYPPMQRSTFAPVHAFIIKQRGSYDTFTVVPPVVKDALGAGGGTPLVNGASQTGRSVVTDGWAGSTAILKAGDFVKFSNHDKVYMVTADVTSDAGGNASLPIEPALTTSPADGGAVTYDDVPFKCYLMGGEAIEYKTDASGFFQFEVEFCEAL